MNELLKQGEEWASRALMVMGDQQAVTPVTVLFPDQAAVAALLQRYFELSESERKRAEALRAAGAAGGKVITPAKSEAARLNGQKAAETHRRKAALRRAAREAEALKKRKRA